MSCIGLENKSHSRRPGKLAYPVSSLQFAPLKFEALVKGWFLPFFISPVGPVLSRTFINVMRAVAGIIRSGLCMSAHRWCICALL